MVFNFDKYKGKYAMHCKTEEEAKDFCRVMNNSGRTWRTGELYTKLTNWEVHKTDTCYSFNMGQQCDINWYKKIGYTILEWGDFMKKEFTKADLKCGCEYCKERKPILDEIGNLQIDDSDSTLWFTFQCSHDDIYEEHTNIKFCPMCGRKLVEE